MRLAKPSFPGIPPRAALDPVRVALVALGAVLLLWTTLVRGEERRPLEFTRLIAHWADYADPDYLAFVEEARPELVQVGFYGAHFWSLANTPYGSGYPAHFPVQGHRECAAWFARLNRELHARDAKVIGHLNVKFLVGDPAGPDGPRGFFKFYRDEWDETVLGPKPPVDALELLERDRGGQPISQQGYAIGGMREYWACLNNPHWQAVLKAWVRFGINQGVDGFVANYFYRHDCHCRHCVDGFRQHLRERYTAEELRVAFGIMDLDRHEFDEIGSWHDPAQSTPWKREALRFSQVANKRAFDTVFVEYGRSLKPDLIVAQWNHLGNLNQISGDERCMLPDQLWGRDEDYLWYSTGGATNLTDLKAGNLGEATLPIRYIRGAFRDKPFTIGRYEHTRLRSAIAELAANGGAPMGFYTPFKNPLARQEIARYYRFLASHDRVYRGNRSLADVRLLYPRRSVQEADMEQLVRFKQLGRALLDAQVLFEVLPDDREEVRRATDGMLVVDPTDPGWTEAALLARLPGDRHRFHAPPQVRVSASAPADDAGMDVHFVNYRREEPADLQSPGAGIEDEKPIATEAFRMEIRVPAGREVRSIAWLTPENGDRSLDLPFTRQGNRVLLEVPAFLVYAVVDIRWQ